MKEPANQLALQIGELAIRGGLISPEHLEDAVRVAEKMNIPLPRVLEMNGYMTEHAVKVALILRKRVDEEQLHLETAIKALVSVAHKGIELETAMRQLNPNMLQVDGQKVTHKLGEVMAAAGIVSSRQLNQGLYNSLNTGLPLGMVLVEMSLVSPLVLEWCLTAQRLVRDKILAPDQAVQALRAARLRRTSFQQSLIDHHYPTTGLQQNFGVGELLVLASVITETQLLAAREIELVSDKKLELVLFECGMASEFMLSASQQLLSMVAEGIIFEDQAAIIVRRLRRASSTEAMEEILSNLQFEIESDEESIELLDLLKDCALVSAEDIESATPIALQNRCPLVKTLLDIGVVNEKTLQSAYQCKQFIETGTLEFEQGAIALIYSVEQDMPFLEALDRFGWNRTFVTIE